MHNYKKYVGATDNTTTDDKVTAKHNMKQICDKTHIVFLVKHVKGVLDGHNIGMKRLDK